MKKLLLLVLSISNILFFIKFSVIRDDTVFANLAQKNGGSIYTEIVVQYEDSIELRKIINVLLENSDKNGSSIRVLQNYPERASLSFIVYGSFFNQVEYNKADRLNFTDVEEKRYYSTEIFDDNAILIPHFNNLPIAKTSTGKEVKYAYTIEPISYIREPIGPLGSGESNIHSFSFQVVEGSSEEYISALNNNDITILSIETVEWEKENLDNNLDVLFGVTYLIMLISFSFIYNVSQKKKLFVYFVNGFGTMESYVRIYILPLLIVVLLSFIPLLVSLFVLFRDYSVLIDDGMKIVIRMFGVLAWSMLFSILLVFIENKFNTVKKSIASWSSILLKILIILLVFPTLIQQSKELKSNYEEYQRYNKLTKIFSNAFTISNEIFLNFIPLGNPSNNLVKKLRIDLDSSGSIYFDSNTHHLSIENYLSEQYGDFIREMKEDYKIFKETESPLKWNTIYVNKNYILENDIIESIDSNYSTLIVPSEYYDQVEKSMKDFKPCQISNCIIVKKNLHIENISQWTLTNIKNFKNPILFVYQEEIEPLEIQNFLYGELPPSNVAGIFNSSRIISNDYEDEIMRTINANDETKNAYSISLDDKIEQVVQGFIPLLAELVRDIIIYSVLLIFLVCQSIVNYQNIYKKDMAVRDLMGYSYIENIQELIVMNVFVYVMTTMMLVLKIIPYFLNIKYSELMSMNTKNVMLGMIIVVISEIIIQILFMVKFKKKRIDYLKGDQI